MLVYLTLHCVILDLAFIVGIGMAYYKKHKLKKEFESLLKGE